ncbi:unnamed protein product [Schistosoma curassoni]|uniref:G_PROTEIN_RECEP_F1_2 domain-containing protein n=1 Tax=Schistosoma curassoni TaxID=6186 RepID=A0A183KGG3_9TREM|nr:unnamed protein product [Schistosoma curassoni]
MCVMYIPEYIIASSIGSFYVPCTIMIVLYYQVFKAIQLRTKRSKLISIRNQVQNYAKRCETMNQTSVISIKVKEVNICDSLENVTYLTAINPQVCDCQSSGIETYIDSNVSYCTESHNAYKANDINDQYLTDINGTSNLSSNCSPITYSETITNSVEPNETNKLQPTPISTNAECFQNSFEPQIPPSTLTQAYTKATNNNVITTTTTTNNDNNTNNNRDIPSSQSEFKNMDDFRKHLKNRIKQAKRSSLSMLTTNVFAGLSSKQVYALNTNIDVKKSTTNRFKSSLSSKRQIKRMKSLIPYDTSKSLNEQTSEQLLKKSIFKNPKSLMSSEVKNEQLNPEVNSSSSIINMTYFLASRSGSNITLKESLAAKREKKATKTLAIVLGRIITSEEDKQKEQKDVINILQFNKSPMKIIRSILKQDGSMSDNNNSNEMPWFGTAVLPYRHGTTEEIQRILKQHRIKI